MTLNCVIAEEVARNSERIINKCIKLQGLIMLDFQSVEECECGCMRLRTLALFLHVCSRGVSSSCAQPRCRRAQGIHVSCGGSPGSWARIHSC